MRATLEVPDGSPPLRAMRATLDAAPTLAGSVAAVVSWSCSWSAAPIVLCGPDAVGAATVVPLRRRSW
ncbi:hypothetical protein AB0I72_22130 [Nocardiopsis sp. NPDC049922]|uniref:hypothetical protein n=1 Tax=Nocardiopsis sp. NPDC049922 TaxID=3155157 RepID=UPI0033E90D4A